MNPTRITDLLNQSRSLLAQAQTYLPLCRQEDPFKAQELLHNRYGEGQATVQHWPAKWRTPEAWWDAPL